jgi:hypothetical protein
MTTGLVGELWAVTSGLLGELGVGTVGLDDGDEGKREVSEEEIKVGITF